MSEAGRRTRLASFVRGSALRRNEHDYGTQLTERPFEPFKVAGVQ